MGDKYTHIVTDTIAAVQGANKFATTFAHPTYRGAEDRLRTLSDEDVALVVRMTGGLDPVDGRIQALVRGARVLEPTAEPTAEPTGAESEPTGAEAPTLAELCATVTISVSPTDAQPPWQEADAAPFRGQGWNVKLGRGELGVNWAEMRVPFWMGEAHGQTKPTAGEVMECLCMDAATIVNSATGPYGAEHSVPRLEEWASDLGMDVDSRRAEAIFDQTAEQADELRAFLGDDFETFIWADQT